jgi:ABC-2 type transport system ATP-binding protein
MVAAPQSAASDGQPEATAVMAVHGTAPEMAAGAEPETGQDAGVVCQRLIKDFGARRVLDEVSFAAPVGMVTGFVGANGAGKTTTMRIVLGLVAPTSGAALVAGKRYVELDRPRRVVGAVLERLGAHPGQTGLAHLRILAAAAGIADRRVPEVLELVGLGDDGHRRVGGYSLGMRQRLALAAALLGDPKILVLDEPANGLDPLGIRWTRGFLRQLADDGRCVLVSSHQLGELEAIADRVVMIDRGRVLADTSTDSALARRGREVTARTRQPQRLAELVTKAGGTARQIGDRELVVRGLTAERIGEIAAGAGVVLHSLVEGGSALEELFLELSGVDRASPRTVDDPTRGEP